VQGFFFQQKVNENMRTSEFLMTQLKEFVFPVIEKKLPLDAWLKEVTLNGEIYTIKVEVGFPAQSLYPILKKALIEFLDLSDIDVQFTSTILPHAFHAELRPISGVKNIIAIASGKGGVGKSTTTINLACALRQEGARVGILDADIYGPNQPQMLGITQRPEANPENKLKPVLAHGLQAMSIGFLINDIDTPMVWRGPMVSSALQQLLNDTVWDNLDYLLIDLPPGTGDIQLTLSQKIPVSGAVIITTPQDIALLDVRKAIRMFEKVRIPVLGVVENMSYYQCPHCHQEDFIFGQGGAENIEADFQVPILGKLPLQQSVREQADQGIPIVIALPENKTSQIYHDIAIRMTAELAQQAKKPSSKFPEIVIEK
jgi:ATP-binding protein involved in chromosome partitioning